MMNAVAGLKWGWIVSGALLGFLFSHLVVLASLPLIFDAELVAVMLDGTLTNTLESYSTKMLIPASVSAVLGGFIGYSFGKLRRAEKALRQSEERFRNMASSAPDAIIMMNSQGSIFYWNQAAERIFGYTATEAIGMELHRVLVPERYYQAFLKGFRLFKDTGQGAAIGKTLELTALRRTGDEFPIELSLSSFKFQDNWQAVGIVRDISDRKWAEAERLQKEKLKGVIEMAGAACHRLNQPIQSILWLTEALLEDFPQEDSRYKDIQSIKEQVDKMKASSKQLMEITKYETLDYYEGIKIIDIDRASENLKK
jgi:PAS domain S-box-containing protein